MLEMYRKPEQNNSVSRKSVALVGFAATTRPYCKDTAADEVWTLNAGWQFTDWGIEWLRERDAQIVTEPDIPRIDRLFDIHRKEYLTDPAYPDKWQWEWLTGGANGIPVYMVEQYPEVPTAMKWDYERISEIVFGNVLRDGERNDYYTSGMCYMLAQAIVEGYQEIEVYGFEMLTGTEYGDQRPAAYYFFGFAAASGCKIILHPESDLMNSKVYGYESAGLVSKQLIEHKLHLRKNEYELAKAHTNQLFTVYQIAAQNGADEAELRAAFDKYNHAKDRLHMTLGALRELEQLVKDAFGVIFEEDLGEPLVAITANQET